MGEVMEFGSPTLTGRERGRPWYNDRTLVGNNVYATGQVPTSDSPNYGERPLFTGFARVLPEDIFLPTDQVVAFITAAIWWGKAIDISWMEMVYQDDRSTEVPIQQHINGLAVFYVDDDLEAFGGALPDSLQEIRIRADCITDIHLDLFPAPLEPEEHHRELARTARYVDVLGDLQTREANAGIDEHWPDPPGIQVDG